MSKRKKSKYKYVRHVIRYGKEVWMLNIKGCTHKEYKTEIEAAKAVDLVLINQGKEPVNILKRVQPEPVKQLPTFRDIGDMDAMFVECIVECLAEDEIVTVKECEGHMELISYLQDELGLTFEWYYKGHDLILFTLPF